MDRRRILHTQLTELFPNIKIYYQPPSKLSYPCIVYDHDTNEVIKADNKNYIKFRRYVITYYSLTPDPTITIDGEDVLVEDILLGLPMCSLDRHYEADNLHHYVFEIYF